MDDECRNVRPWPVPKQTLDGKYTFFFYFNNLLESYNAAYSFLYKPEFSIS